MAKTATITPNDDLSGLMDISFRIAMQEDFGTSMKPTAYPLLRKDYCRASHDVNSCHGSVSQAKASTAAPGTPRSRILTSGHGRVYIRFEQGIKNPASFQQEGESIQEKKDVMEVFACVLVAVISNAALGAAKGFLRIGDIKGEAQDQDHKDRIIIESMGSRALATPTAAQGTGGPGQFSIKHLANIEDRVVEIGSCPGGDGPDGWPLLSESSALCVRIEPISTCRGSVMLSFCSSF